jgi:hypothetical protein
MKNKIRVLTRIGVAISLTMAMGCAMSLETKVEKAGETGLNNIYASAARVRNPLGQEAIAIEIHAEAKQPELAYRRTTVITPTAAPQAAPPAKTIPSEMPKDLKSAKLRWVPPSQPCSPPKQPAPPQVVVDEEGYYPSTTPLANAGGVGAGFLQTWGNAALGNAPMALGMYGAAKVLKPAQTNVTQTGGGANQQQGQATRNTNINPNTNINIPTANSGSSSSSASSAAAAAAAAAGN